MSAASRKPAVPGRVESPAPSTSPARGHGARPSISGSSTPRRQSVRGGTPVSARAAALQRRDSPLSNASDADDARAETVALIDDLKSRLSTAESSSEQYKLQADVLQNKLDEVHKEHATLEEKVHETDEHIEALKNEKRDAARQMREMEAIYEAERSSMTKEKEEMGNREEEMQMVIQRLKDSLNQRNNGNPSEDDVRQSRQPNSSPNLEGGSFAPPSSIQRSDSRNSSKILLQKDKLIESLRLELAEAQIKLVESENQGGGRLREVERLLMEARMANARLMEDNESYQLLLQEKTLNGDFAKSDFGFNNDALNALEGRSSNGDTDQTPDDRVHHVRTMSSLADELSEAQEDDERTRKLEIQLNTAKDQNKALTLYINKIIERLLQHSDFEAILDQSNEYKPGGNTNKELPPPPPPKPQSSPGTSFLQRAKSMAIGTGSATSTGSSPAKPRPRPMSVMPLPAPPTEDPERAPSIPLGLGRSTSVRRSRPMSEQFPGAANVVNQMYRGPEAKNGTTSPSLVSPRSSTAVGPIFSKRSSSGAQYQPQAQHLRELQQQREAQHHHGHHTGTATTPTTMTASTATTAVASPKMTTGGNFPGMKSETSSTVSSGGDSIGIDGNGSGGSRSMGGTPPPGSSPPRSGGGVHEKMTFGAGTKPRPLRLVQENNDVMQANNKRASWFGWMSGAGGKKEEGLGGLGSPADPNRVFSRE